MSEHELRQSLKGAIKLRAMMYYYIFDELRQEVGEATATAVLSRAIERGGRAAGGRFAVHAPADLEGLKKAFLDWVPDKGAMFQPEVCHCSAERLEIKFHACPLKEAYQEAGLSPEETAKMLAIAGAIDHGVFAAAGFEFDSETWRPGQEGCCRLKIKPGQK
jgi:hypothetical protein